MVTEASKRPDHAITVESSDAPGDATDRVRPMRERFQVMQTFWSEIHARALEDDRFVGGEHWPEQIRQEREEDGRPVLTYNLLPSFTRQIINKVRQERPQLKIRPVESDRYLSEAMIKNLQGTRDYSLADVFSGIIRNIEHVSRADQAYDTALAHAVDHSFGWFLITNDWSRIDPFVQELRIRRVKDSYTVLTDPAAEEADLSDMQDAFIAKMVNRETFKQKYPTASLDSFVTGYASAEGWFDEDSIRIAHYYRIDWRGDHVLLLSNGKLVYENDVKDVLDELEHDEGIYIQRDSRGRDMRKAVKRPVCTWQKITAHEVLEGPLDLPFEHVPLCAVLGDERIVDGKIRYESATRHSMDAQRSYNYWRTSAAETVALSPRAPWMGTEKQFAGHEGAYETANRRNHPYLTYNHVDGVPPPQRQFPSGISAAELQLATQDARDIQTIIGLHDASLGRESNEKSGRAIERRQAQGLTSTFQFPDNLARAQEHMGRILISAIPKIYDTQRVMRIRLPDDSEDFVEINKSVVDEETGKRVLVHDLGVGRYDVVMETGIDYATQRQEARDTQLEILKLVGPEVAGKIVHAVVENIGGPGADKVAEILRKLLPDELKSDEERRADLPPGVTVGPGGQPIVEETGEPWQRPLTAAEQLMQQEQEVERLKADAEIATAESKKKDADARIRQAEAKLAEAEAKLAELEKGPEGDQARDDAQFLKDVEALIKQYMEAHEDNPNAHTEAYQEKLTDANVAVLERVKRYVDRLVPSEPTDKAAESNVVPITDAKKAEARRIKFRYDGDGNLVGADLEPTGEHIALKRDDAGDLTEADVTEGSPDEDQNQQA